MRIVVVLFPLHTTHDISLTIVQSQNEHVKHVKKNAEWNDRTFFFFLKSSLDHGTTLGVNGPLHVRYSRSLLNEGEVPVDQQGRPGLYFLPCNHLPPVSLQEAPERLHLSIFALFIFSHSPCASLSLIGLSLYLSSHLYVLSHSTVPSFSSAASPLSSCVPPSFVSPPHPLHAPSSPALSNPFTFFLAPLLSALPPKNADRRVSEMAFPCEKSHRPANRLE